MSSRWNDATSVDHKTKITGSGGANGRRRKTRRSRSREPAFRLPREVKIPKSLLPPEPAWPLSISPVYRVRTSADIRLELQATDTQLQQLEAEAALDRAALQAQEDATAANLAAAGPDPDCVVILDNAEDYPDDILDQCFAEMVALVSQ